MLINSQLDKSSKSINFLKNRIKEIFPADELLFFPDDLTEDFRTLPKDKLINIVLFGSFTRSLLESGFWNFEKIKLYVLCESVKESIVDLFNISPQKVSVIPRAMLEKREVEQRDIDPKTSCNFVYAGRINESKNIETLIYFFHYLQSYYKASLTLIGPFDEQQKLVFGDNSALTNSYENTIRELIKNLTWTTPPTIVEELPLEEWANHAPGDPIYISLSTSLFEDYGVSITQCLEKGWPVILSDWGGHKDVMGNGVYKIPYDYLPHSKEFKLKGKVLAELFREKRLGQKMMASKEFVVPETLGQEALKKIRDEFFTKYGQESLLITRDHWSDFYQTAAGIKFINTYRDHFRGDLSDRYVCIVTNDFFNDDLIKEKMDAFDPRGRGIIIFGLHELISPEVIRTLVGAEEIYTTFNQDFVAKTSPHIKAVFNNFETSAM